MDCGFPGRGPPRQEGRGRGEGPLEVVRPSAPCLAAPPSPPGCKDAASSVVGRVWRHHGCPAVGHHRHPRGRKVLLGVSPVSGTGIVVETPLPADSLCFPGLPGPGHWWSGPRGSPSGNQLVTLLPMCMARAWPRDQLLPSLCRCSRRHSPSCYRLAALPPPQTRPPTAPRPSHCPPTQTLLSFLRASR